MEHKKIFKNAIKVNDGAFEKSYMNKKCFNCDNKILFFKVLCHSCETILYDNFINHIKNHLSPSPNARNL